MSIIKLDLGLAGLLMGIVGGASEFEWLAAEPNTVSGQDLEGADLEVTRLREMFAFVFAGASIFVCSTRDDVLGSGENDGHT